MWLETLRPVGPQRALEPRLIDGDVATLKKIESSLFLMFLFRVIRTFFHLCGPGYYNQLEYYNL